MGLSVEITHPPDREWFTSSESVHGTVVWQKQSSSSVARVVVRLEGQLKLALRSATSHHRHPVGPAPHVIFVQEAVIFPVSNNGQQALSTGRSTLGSGIHRFPFELRFPQVGEISAEKTGCSHCQKALPPTLKFTADAFSGAVTYSVRAVVERDQLLRPKLNAIREVKFRPLLPTTALLIDQPWKVTKEISSSPLCQGQQGDDSIKDITFEMAFPPSRTIRPGDHIDIGMTLAIPTDVQRRWKELYIFQIVVRLKTTTVMQNGAQVRNHSGQTDACNIKGLFPMPLLADYARVVLPPQLWQCHVYPSVLPTIALCKMQRMHSLEVTVTFVADNQRFSVATQIDVTVESGAMIPSDAPPAYS